ncbi:MAG: phosphoribosylformylglycinamidine synthase I [Rhodothermales bacterium]|jgi:phosphoribosylformylglycinamidine synthase I
MSIRALVITGYGLNCEVETAAAFEASGAEAVCVHLSDLMKAPEQLLDHHILAFIGGFSFGDHLGAGTVFANRIQAHLGDVLGRFVQSGRLVIGICNGMQTLTRLGLVPALDGAYFTPQVGMAHNDSAVFRDAWVTLRANPDSPCVFTRGLGQLALPIRHGEGKFTASSETLAAIRDRQLIALQYEDPETGEPTEEFPHNPNGSTDGIAGICDETGRIFGLMPHPEAYLSPFNHPHWTRQKISGVLPEQGLGLQIFQNAVSFAQAEL